MSLEGQKLFPILFASRHPCPQTAGISGEGEGGHWSVSFLAMTGEPRMIASPIRQMPSHPIPSPLSAEECEKEASPPLFPVHPLLDIGIRFRALLHDLRPSESNPPSLRFVSAECVWRRPLSHLASATNATVCSTANEA